jgi:hypothetical protein
MKERRAKPDMIAYSVRGLLRIRHLASPYACSHTPHSISVRRTPVLFVFLPSISPFELILVYLCIRVSVCPCILPLSQEIKDKYPLDMHNRLYGHLPGVPVGCRLNGRGEAAIVGLHRQMSASV